MFTNALVKLFLDAAVHFVAQLWETQLNPQHRGRRCSIIFGRRHPTGIQCPKHLDFNVKFKSDTIVQNVWISISKYN